MRLTLALSRIRHNINVYRLAKLKWEFTKRNKVSIQSTVIENVTDQGYPLVDAQDYLAEIIKNDIVKKTPEEVPVVEELEKKIVLDETHPLYKSSPCYCLGDNSVLVRGVEQCKSLLNLVQIEDGLPESIERRVGLHSIPFQDPRVERCIKYSHIYDAMQVKLPKRKDPARPAWIFPRDYGIDANRKFELLTFQLLQFCDYIPETHLALNRSILSDAFCNSHLDSEGTPLQLQTHADILITSKSPLPPLAPQDSGKDVQLPDLHPLKCTVSVPSEHFYHGHSIFPLSNNARNSHPHTAIVHFNPSEVKNLYEEPVSESQFMARTLTQSFTIAASRAQQLYGDDVRELPEPITLQTIHTDTKRFHFAILQLNTLTLNKSSSLRNLFWMMQEPINLYSECAYVNGRPTLEGYNSEVFQRLLAFYSM